MAFVKPEDVDMELPQSASLEFILTGKYVYQELCVDVNIFVKDLCHAVSEVA